MTNTERLTLTFSNDMQAYELRHNMPAFTAHCESLITIYHADLTLTDNDKLNAMRSTLAEFDDIDAD